MPEPVDQLSEHQKAIVEKINELFTTEQQCAFFLGKTIQSIYQMDDEKVHQWLEAVDEKHAADHLTARQTLIHAYTRFLIDEQLCQNHVEYWVRHCPDQLVDDITAFLSGKPPHLAVSDADRN